MKKILKKSLHILCTTLGIIPFMLTSCNYLAVDEYFNDLTPLDSIFARQDYLERYVWGTAALMPAQGNLFSEQMIVAIDASGKVAFTSETIEVNSPAYTRIGIALKNQSKEGYIRLKMYTK